MRTLPSGRFQARYCVDLVWHSSPTTFRIKREADAYLASVRSDVDGGSWIDPDAGKVRFEEYSSHWLAERPHLRPRTRELYEGELRLHFLPALGAAELREITPSRIRTWRADMISAGKPGASTIAKCYRLVHAVFATAVEDGVVVRNPCIVKGASTERPAERPPRSWVQDRTLRGEVHETAGTRVPVTDIAHHGLPHIRFTERARPQRLPPSRTAAAW